MKDLSAIEIHLTLKNHEDISGAKIQSCLTAALTEARILTGRNQDTGVPDSWFKPELGRWSGAMCYSTILDQIGTCYKRKGVKTLSSNTPSIKKVLHYFTNLSEDKINALYALRCAFLHDFNLINTSHKPELQHVFNVFQHPTKTLIELPEVKWDGNLYDLRSLANFTSVNLLAFGNMVEDIYNLLILLNSENILEITLAGGEHELLNRYTFSINS